MNDELKAGSLQFSVQRSAFILPFDALGAEESGEAFGRLFEPFQPRAGRARARLPEDAADFERPFRALELRVDARDEAVAFEHGQDVVAELSRGLGHERLEAVVEAEQALGA